MTQFWPDPPQVWNFTLFFFRVRTSLNNIIIIISISSIKLGGDRVNRGIDRGDATVEQQESEEEADPEQHHTNREVEHISIHLSFSSIFSKFKRADKIESMKICFALIWFYLLGTTE